MKLKRKLFFFSIGIAGVVGSLLLLYILLLMPSMYLDYTKRKNLSNVKEAHQSFVDTGTVHGIDNSIKGNFIGVAIPQKGYRLRIEGNYFRGNLEIPKGDMRKAFDEAKRFYWAFSKKDVTSEAVQKQIKDKVKDLGKTFKKGIQQTKGTELFRQWKTQFKEKDNSINYEEQSAKFYRLGNASGLGEFTVKDSLNGNRYTSYIGIAKKGEALYVTFATVATPSVDDIRPVVATALPMIIAVIIILGFAISNLLAKHIINPISALARDADFRRYDKNAVSPIRMERKDELGDLADSLNQLYYQQEKSYRQLEEANKMRDVFMKASSHQLKTPLSAALLLIDGMISNTGKFSDRNAYLPETKQQLLSMRKMIDEILKINRMAEEIQLSSVSLKEVVEVVLLNHKIQADAGEITYSVQGSAVWKTDGELIYQITDNLIQNAISYSCKGGQVQVYLSEKKIEVVNAPAEIPKELLENIFEPFVSGNDGKEGHGLGLYVVKYFAELLQLNVSVVSENHQVTVTIERETA